MEQQPVRKPRVLCLHAFRTSGKIFEKMTEVWPEFVREKMDLVFIDAPFPAEGGSGVQGKFDPPYYEWFQFNQDFSEYRNFDECIAYIEDCMIRMGPFDGLFGFSQGVALTSVPVIKFVMLMSGSKLGGSMFSSPRLAKNAFSSPIQCPSLHFLGEKDGAKPNGIELLDSFVDPLVIHHPEGHVVPKLGIVIQKCYLHNRYVGCMYNFYRPDVFGRSRFKKKNSFKKNFNFYGEKFNFDGKEFERIKVIYSSNGRLEIGCVCVSHSPVSINTLLFCFPVCKFTIVSFCM
ncbi:uncharacterized protein LOC131302387 isoform X2 [Rhododendron vialii]|uniref:uncharacterized protein LOC131302387 isoform X2 n=1 Tax=Rhododendron vialii TaxID=182163 RepID=UPI00265E996B|nr:uncharacterized protein LOC131302387 isoform X2 [Rhododendron vialii]